MFVNVCQYWNENELPRCVYWDNESSKCTNTVASFYPNCNKIGTLSKCPQYIPSSDEVISTCILPDPTRHVCNRGTGNKWQISEINGYNGGACDGRGTFTTCSGYSPYHLAFSKPFPSTLADLSPTGGGAFSIVGDDEFKARLPFYYLVANIRAKLSRCYWWAGDSIDFRITSSGTIVAPTFKCVNSDEVVQKFSTNSFDESTGTIIGACNGAKPECPGYTGVCWKWCVDEYMRQGDKIRAEQILELRYYMRAEKWVKPDFETFFNDYPVWAWSGPDNLELKYDQYGVATEWLIGSIENRIDNFNGFNLIKTQEVLTQGTPDIATKKPDYPTLVRFLYDPWIKPIIRNQFVTKESVYGSRPPAPSYDYDGNLVENEKFFEATYVDHDELVIWGDAFYYMPEIYAFNLADPDVAELFPKEISDYNSVFEIRTALYTADDVSASEEEFNKVYTSIERGIYNMLYTNPTKVYISEMSGEDGAFFIPVSTFFGENDIVVFSKGSGTWEYDRVKFCKILTNGILAQTDFKVNGDGKPVTYLPNWESSFMADKNGGDAIKFEFKPFIPKKGAPAKADYVFNDSVVDVIPANPSVPMLSYDLGYEMKEVDINTVVVSANDIDLVFFGTSGYCMLRVANSDFNSVHGPPKLENIVLSAQGKVIAMEVFEVGTDRIEVDQVFLKPVDINGPSGFKRPCVDDNSAGISIGNCVVYKKDSFDDVSGVVVREDWLPPVGTPNTQINYKKTLSVATEEKDGENPKYTLTKIGDDSIVFSLVYKGGVSGLVKGITKTKALVWVRQPLCRDVEIYYKWAASYAHRALLPRSICDPLEIGENYIEDTTNSWTPWCGDHYLSPYDGIGYMWHPYHSCEQYDTYKRLSAGGELFENNVMEVFEEVDATTGMQIHGAWDLRMLGPWDWYGYRGEGSASLWACSCDFRYYNYERIGDNRFIGRGRIRCGVSIEEILKMTEWGGEGPQFGNPYRDNMRSYRSFDSEYYYYYDLATASYVRLKKWMPAPYQFGFVDLTQSPTDSSFKLYCSDDYTENASNADFKDKSVFVHPLSILHAIYTIEGVVINEVINENRVRYEDVLEGHSNIGWLNYPRPKTTYYASAALIPVKSWYTYKVPSCSVADSVQFVWQEKWKPMERGSIAVSVPMYIADPDSINKCATISNPDYEGGYVNFPYMYENNVFSGQHKFIDIEYPEYKYSANLDEKRIVCEEGTHIISVHCPRWDKGDTYFWMKLDDGCWRPFDLDGNWDPVGSDVVENPSGGYQHVVYSSWFIDVECGDIAILWSNVFNTLQEAKDFAETEELFVNIYDDITGVPLKLYYMYGINVFFKSVIDYLPSLSKLLDNSKYQIKYTLGTPVLDSGVPDCLQVYPSSYTINAIFDANNTDYGEIELHVDPSSIDDVVGLVNKLRVFYKFGYGVNNCYYHIPAVSISVDGVVVYTCDTMTICNKKDSLGSLERGYEWHVVSKSIYNMIISAQEHVVKIRFRLQPTITELSLYGITYDNFFNQNNYIKVEVIYPYAANFSEGVENITTYERMYRFSTGACGDAGFPPAGNNNQNLLTIPGSEGSTVYQHDNRSGIIGASGTTFGNLKNDWLTDFVITMDKHRGRFIGAVFDDEYALTGSNVLDWETYQKKIYDGVALQGVDEFQLAAVLPPGFDDILNDVSVSFSFNWLCLFENTLLTELAQVAAQENYNPCGFKWKHKLMTVAEAYGFSSIRCADFVNRSVLVRYYYGNSCVSGGWYEDLFEVYANRVWGMIFKTFAEDGLNVYAPNIQPGIGKYWAGIIGSTQTPPVVPYHY